MNDPVVNAVIKKFKERSEAGISKYGTTLADNTGDLLYWITHAQEEAMDFILYLERMKSGKSGPEVVVAERKLLDFPWLDSEGYPTEKLLDFIRDYKPDEEIPLLVFLSVIKSTWWNDEHGFIRTEDEEGEFLTLHTSGWSGNEDIIKAMLANLNLTLFHMMYVQWSIGGHYRFKINEL